MDEGFRAPMSEASKKSRRKQTNKREPDLEGNRYKALLRQEKKKKTEDLSPIDLINRPWTNYAMEDERPAKTTITFISFNILADSLIKESYLPYLKPEQAAWHSRSKRIIDYLVALKGDIICLQEVEEAAYNNLFKPEFVNTGYFSIFCPRGGDKKDGCATFIRKDKAEIVKCVDVPLHVQGHPVLDRFNVSLITVIEIKIPNSSENKRIAIANLHLLFNPNRGDVKLAQLQHAMCQLEKVARDFHVDGVILCGDFNLVPFSPLYTYLCLGGLGLYGLDRRNISGQNLALDAKDPLELSTERCPCRHQGSGTSKGVYVGDKLPKKFYKKRLQQNNVFNDFLSITWHPWENNSTICNHRIYAEHGFQFQSSYAQQPDHTSTGEPAFTCYHGKFKGTVDYVFFGTLCGHKNALRRSSVLEIPLQKELEINGGLPNKFSPSDHVPLCVIFEVV